jgi:TRAP-type C4-dicarboxylate transport system permease small subunit
LIHKVLSNIDRAIGNISFYAMLFSGILIVVMGILSTYAVARRYLLHNPEPYSYELSTIMLVACVVFSIGYLQRQGRHLRVDFISNYFNKNAQDILLNVATPIMALVYVIIITWQSWINALYSLGINETSQSAWQEPLGPTKLCVSVGAFLLCLVLVAQLAHGIASSIRILRGKKAKEVAVAQTPPEGS